MIFLQILKSIFVWILVIFPTLILYTFPFLLLRLLHHVIAKIVRPDLTPLVKWQDVLYSNVGYKTDNENIGGFVLILTGNISVIELRKHFYKTFLSSNVKDKWRYENLLTIFVKFGCYLFKEKLEGISLKEHILEYDGPVLKDVSEVKSFVSKWFKAGKEEGVPCWEIIVVNQIAGKSYILFKCHHGLMDGYSTALFMEKLMGTRFPYQNKETQESFLQKCWLSFIAPAILFDRLLNHNASENSSTINHLKNEEETNSWGMEWMFLDLLRVKEIRRKLGVRFTSVFAGLQVGALKKVADKENFGDELSLVFPVGIKNHPAMSGGSFTNHLSADSIEIPTNYDSLSTAILTAEKNNLKETEEGKRKLVDLILTPLILYPMPYQVMQFMSKFFVSKFLSSMFIGFSCHMFAEEKMVLLGKDVEDLIMLVNTSAATPMIHLYTVTTTYNGKLSVSINPRNSFMNSENLKSFTKYLQEEVHELHSFLTKNDQKSKDEIICIENN